MATKERTTAASLARVVRLAFGIWGGRQGSAAPLNRADELHEVCLDSESGAAQQMPVAALARFKHAAMSGPLSSS